VGKILVTGAAGFIGSHLVERLLDRGDEVVGLDDFNAYYDPALKRRNARELASHPRSSRLELIEGSICDKEVVKRAFGRHPDTVVHLAGMPGVKASLETPGLYVDVNVHGTLNLLQGAHAAGVKPFVFASTSSAYGNTQRLPFQEDDSADRPLAPYAASKRAAELFAHTFHKLYGLKVTVLRFFTVYGPRNRPDMMAHKLLESITKGREIPLYDGGQMTRDWTFVGDTVQGILGAVDHPQEYEIINLGRGEPTLLLDFVRALEAKSGKKANVVNSPRQDFDAVATAADISKAKRLLGYAPKTSVSAGVGELWDWYQREPR
jgi:UDP-glucuronate 4-epimerase